MVVATNRAHSFELAVAVSCCIALALIAALYYALQYLFWKFNLVDMLGPAILLFAVYITPMVWEVFIFTYRSRNTPMLLNSAHYTLVIGILQAQLTEMATLGTLNQEDTNYLTLELEQLKKKIDTACLRLSEPPTTAEM
jgi:hypothetical protein